MKLTYEELEQRVLELEKKAELVDRLQTQINNNEQFLDILLNTIPNPVFYKDIEGIYQKANDAFSKTILGINKDKIVGKSLFDLPEVIPYDLASVYYNKDKELFNNPGTQIYESEVKCADGIKRFFYFYKATVENNLNEVIGLIGVMLDVTELKHHQEQLNKRNALLSKLSYKDALTGIYNRRKFDEIFPKKIALFQREKNILNFVLIDVDYFKKYNDTYGHYKGDNVLKIIAATIKSKLNREGDYLFRVGGEEFGIFFESPDEIKAKNFVEKIREEIELLQIEHENNESYNNVTISCGLVSIKSGVNDSRVVFEEADRQLYKAKKLGRNQTCSKLYK